MKKNQTKRLLALVLTLALTLSNVPTTVFAEDVTATEPQSTTEQQVQSQEETTEQVINNSNRMKILIHSRQNMKQSFMGTK
ncbi:MAG: hypothetical protein ACLSVM_02650 [Coprococcus phoceensis]